jgi:hypothetical protein
MKLITQTTVSQWAANLSAGGLRRWWTLGSLTRHRDQPAAARLLAQCLQTNAPPSMSERAGKSLRRVTLQPAKDAVIDCWLEDKTDETARHLIETQGWRHSDVTHWLKFLNKRNRFDEYFVAELTPLVNDSAIARMLAHPEAAKASKDAAEAAAAALRQISKPDAKDAMIDCWLEGKAGETVRQLIEAQSWQHTDKTHWLKFLTQRNRFDEYFVAQLAPLVNHPSVALMLAHPEAAKASKSAAEAAAAALRQITAQESMDAVIDGWLEDKAGETARQVIEKRGWQHSDETHWLKFLTQRNRFDEYFVEQLAPLVNHPAIALMLAHPEGADAEQAALVAGAAALGQITAQESMDAVIDGWLEDKAGETARQVIEKRGWQHSDEAQWLKFLTRRNRFDEYFVAELAPLVSYPSVARMLAHPEAAKASKSATEAAAAALRQISTSDAMDAMIDCWLEDNAGEAVRQVIEAQSWRHSDKTHWIKFLTQRNRFDEYFVAELAPLVNQPAVARMLAHPEGGNADQTAAGAAADALGLISAPEAVDAVIDCCLEEKAGETARQVIEEQGWRHSDEARWIKFLTQRNRFDEYFVAELAPLVNQPELVGRLLARLGGADASQAARLAVAAALGQITAPEAVDVVIDSWLEDKADVVIRQVVDERDLLQSAEVPWFELYTKQKGRAGEIVRKVIEDRGWRHSEEARWFLYLAATERFDEYLTEDYDFQTLRPEFLAASTALKARIREAVVKAGEVRMNGLFLAEKRATELTLADAEALVHINIRNHNWEALAGYFWWLPARQTLDAVQAIIAAKWMPDDPDQAALLVRLGELAPLLATGAPERQDYLPLNPVYQKWLASGETGPLSSKSPAELKAMLQDETDPPDQIASLGALRKQDQLDVATVAKAGLSEHWMVRWVAVHFGADLSQAMQVNDAGIEWFRRLAILRNDGGAEALWTAKPCEVTRDGLEALREHLARLPDPRAAGGLLLVEAICAHFTAHDIEVEEGARVLVEEDSFELEG